MTKEELYNAMEYVLGEEVFYAFYATKYPLPQILNIAALKAFAHESTYPQPIVDILRRALVQLEEDGQFNFEPGP